MSKEVRVDWAGNDSPYYVGKNGEGLSQGVRVTNYNGSFNILHIEPVNSKGQIARCVVSVPLDKVDEFVAALIAARGLLIGDKVRTLVEIKMNDATTLHAGSVGEVVERYDGCFLITVSLGRSGSVEAVVRPHQVERVVAPRIGDKVRTTVEMKANYRTAGDVRTVTLHAGHVGELVERMDDGQFVFDAMHGINPVRSYVSPNEVERI
jgi:hypothetical protein